MKTDQPGLARFFLRHIGSPATLQRKGMLAMGVLLPFFCCGAISPTGCKPESVGGGNGPVIGGIAAIAVVAVGTVVLVEVNHSHHRLKGCITADSNGIQLETLNDRKSYLLEGNTQDFKPGELVQLHGTKVQAAKDSSGEQVFRVEKLSRDFGPCDISHSPAKALARFPAADNGLQTFNSTQTK